MGDGKGGCFGTVGIERIGIADRNGSGDNRPGLVRSAVQAQRSVGPGRNPVARRQAAGSEKGGAYRFRPVFVGYL